MPGGLDPARGAGSAAPWTDGVKVRLEDGWFILRTSNTEPIVRVIAESTTEERARALAERVLAEVASWNSDPPSGS